MRIAHATESFDISDISFIHAVGLAAHSGESEVVTCHVTQGWAAQQDTPGPAALLERWGMASVPVSHRVHECFGHDDIAEGVIVACESVKPDLLIMATHARTGLGRVLVGSIAEAVARNVAVPTLLLPHGVPSLVDPRTGALALHRVLILGGSQSDTDLGVDAAAWFLRALVDTTCVDLSLLHAGRGSAAPYLDDPGGMSIKLNLRRGSVENAVAGVIPQRQPDLIVSVSHGHDELRDILLSSHTERVLHQARRPLLWVPPSFDRKS